MVSDRAEYSIAKHLTIEQLEQYYRQAKDGVESRQYQIIWLLAQGKKTLEVEEITGYSRTWIYALVKRYNFIDTPLEAQEDSPKSQLDPKEPR